MKKDSYLRIIEHLAHGFGDVKHSSTVTANDKQETLGRLETFQKLILIQSTDKSRLT